MYVNVCMSMYLSFCLSFSFSTHIPLPYLSVFFQRESEREREREREREWAGQEMFYARKYLFNTKEGINEDTGEQKIHKAYWQT